jgi:hypothetical protein
MALKYAALRPGDGNGNQQPIREWSAVETAVGNGSSG